MKKVVGFFMAAVMLFGLAVPFNASEIDSKISNSAENIVQISDYIPTEPASAAAIVNNDSFVDKTANQTNFDLPCKAALLMDQSTGQILYEKNIIQQMPIASITKVMTMLLVMEAVDSGKIKMQDTVPISKHAFSMGGSQIWLEPGEIFTVHELMKAVAVASANDAAVALAEFIGGSESVFCDMMNRRAEELGMKDTHFVNACGLDAEGHLSTAADVAIMSRELMKHEKIFEYTTIWMDYLRDGKTQLVNTNKLLRSYTGTNGLKTGTTSGAGVCITAAATRGDLSLIAVVLGSDTSEERFAAAKKLFDFGFSNFESRQFPSVEDYPQYIAVRKSVKKEVKIEYNLPSKLLFLKGAFPQIESRITLPESLEAPLEKGTVVGSVDLYSKGEKIKEYNITLAEDAEKLTFGKAFDLLMKIVAGNVEVNRQNVIKNEK